MIKTKHLFKQKNIFKIIVTKQEIIILGVLWKKIV